jgi:Tol biopolymer transport system component
MGFPKRLRIRIIVLIVIFIVAGTASYILLLAPNRGAKVTALANTSADERYPIWSPDGSKIFFRSDNWICVCNPDGSRHEKLTEIEEDFVFSPDMRRVFYKKTVSNEDKVTYQAYVMDIDGKNHEKIAELTLEEKYVDDRGYIGHTGGPMYWMHSWSPDRTKIFFKKLEETDYTWVYREEEGKWKRYMAGTEPSIPVLQEVDSHWEGTKLISKEHESTAWIWDLKENELRFIGDLSYGIVHYNLRGEIVWSPDGKYVALPCSELSETGETRQIFVVNMETGESIGLTSFIGANTWPTWSPDSMTIMYVQVPPRHEMWWWPGMFQHNEGCDIWMVDIDGSDRKQLTDIPKNWEEGIWSPDGSKIVYYSQQVESKGYEIWTMNTDGSDKKLLVKVERLGDARWSPDGSKIAYVAGKLHNRDIYVIDMPK